MSDIRNDLKIIASNLIRRGGYNAFSFRDLATNVGVKSSTVHYYFPTKADLVEEITTDYKNSFFERLNAESAKMSSPSSKVLHLIKFYEESLSKDLNCLCGILATEIDLLSPKERDAIKSFYNQLEKWLKATLGSDSQIGMDTNEVVHLVMSALNGAVVLDRVYEGKKRLNAIKSFISMTI